MRAWLVLLVVTFVAALAVLASLQYRWIGDLSAAEESRLRAALDAGARHVAEDVDREVGRIGGTFRDSSAAAEDLARSLRLWTASARDPRILAGVFVAHGRGTNPPQLERLVTIESKNLARLDEVEWPADLQPIARIMIMKSPDQRPPRVPQMMRGIPALCVPSRNEEPPPRPPNGPPDGPPPDRRPFDRRPPPDGRFGGYPPPPPPPEADRPRPRERAPALLVLQIDRAYLAGVLVPEVAKRYLAARDFDIAVLGDGDVLYRSDPSWPPSVADNGEASAPFLMMGVGDNQNGGPPWRLVVRRHGTPLAAMVAETRQRNLAVGFAVLLLLAASIVLLVVLARRAERFRVQQLDFVAGITHELNTPIAAVSSAAQNLADGIVTEPAQVTRYGSMIAKEARRLSETVAQVLDFAGLQSRNAPAERATVDVGSIVDEAIAQCRWLAEERGVTIDANVPRDLPLVDGDGAALTRAVQNLVANAIRHGGDGKWAGVTASRENKHVAIRVEDRGAGIAARDLPHLFEPFYRGRDAARVRGSGLGLAIVKQIAAAHGGSIAVETKRDRGSAFILKLEIAEHA